MIGYDMRHNLEVDWSTVGEYGTDLYSRKAVEVIERHDQTSPLFLYLSQIAPHAGTASNSFQVPIEEEEKFSYIPDAKRRKYAGKRNEKSIPKFKGQMYSLSGIYWAFNFIFVSIGNELYMQFTN